MKRTDLSAFTISELLDRFAEIAVSQDNALLYQETGKFNKLFSRLDEIEVELRRRGTESVLALVRLYDHPNAQVRLVSAQRSRDLAPALARKVFETIVASREFPQAANAAMSLRNLDTGVARPSHP